MRKSLIQQPSGRVFGYGTATNNPNEYPPPHGLDEGAVAVVIHDTDRELTNGPGDTDTFKERIKQYKYRNGLLHPRDGGPPLKAQCVEKLRMKDGALEDSTVDGWKPRAIFEPEIDDDGEEIEGPDGMPEGQWYAMGPRTKDGNPNLIPIGKPDPEDRRVWKGTEGNEIEPDSPIVPNSRTIVPGGGTT